MRCEVVDGLESTLHSIVDTVVSYVHGLEEPHLRYYSVTEDDEDVRGGRDEL